MKSKLHCVCKTIMLTKKTGKVNKYTIYIYIRWGRQSHCKKRFFELCPHHALVPKHPLFPAFNNLTGRCH